MRILICCGREYANQKRLLAAFQPFLDFHTYVGRIVIIHGACGWPNMTGADAMADKLALSLGLSPERYPADWKKHGKAAGPIRNQEMFDKSRPNFVIAFPGGSGTRNMVEITRAAIHGGSECILMEVS